MEYPENVDALSERTGINRNTIATVIRSKKTFSGRFTFELIELLSLTNKK